MPERRITAETGGRLNVKGSIKAMHPAGPIPGKTPMRVPKKTPMRHNPKSMGFKITENPKIRFCIVSTGYLFRDRAVESSAPV